MLREVTRRLVNRVWLRPLPGPFVHDEGFGWAARLPGLARHADADAHPRRSTLVIYEDGRPLQSAHAAPRDVRSVGLGRYAHRGDLLLFSASDNSDPTRNGRQYAFSVSLWLYRRRVDRPEIDPRLPVNHRKRDYTPAMIRRDVDFTLQVGGVYLDALRQLMPSLEGKTVLEVGPGIHFGFVLVLAAYGARPQVADRYLAPWDAGYHPRYYALLRDELCRRDPRVDAAPLTAILRAKGYPADVITRHETALEQLAAPDNSVDVVFSNAVAEHLYDPRAAFKRLYRLTRPGGWGLHQVDFRDHRNFQRPLEYLLMSEEEFRTEYDLCHGECGNRFRPEEMTEQIRAAGFEVLQFQGNLFAELEYLRDFVPRLRAAARSRYRDWDADGLHVLSGFYRLGKPTAAS
jgi:SAM-dependent methyltransferase